jgi:hypothetical protein
MIMCSMKCKGMGLNSFIPKELLEKILQEEKENRGRRLVHRIHSQSGQFPPKLG